MSHLEFTAIQNLPPVCCFSYDNQKAVQVKLTETYSRENAEAIEKFALDNPLPTAQRKPQLLPTPLRLVMCNICGYMPDVNSFSSVRTHIHKVSPTIFTCIICGEREIAVELIKNHMNAHRPALEFCE